MDTVQQFITVYGKLSNVQKIMIMGALKAGVFQDKDKLDKVTTYIAKRYKI